MWKVAPIAKYNNIEPSLWSLKNLILGPVFINWPVPNTATSSVTQRSNFNATRSFSFILTEMIISTTPFNEYQLMGVMSGRAWPINAHEMTPTRYWAVIKERKLILWKIWYIWVKLEQDFISHCDCDCYKTCKKLLMNVVIMWPNHGRHEIKEMSIILILWLQL